MIVALAVPTAVAFVVSVVGNRVAIAIAKRLSFVDRPGAEAHKQQARAIPYGGGAAMAIALTVGLLMTLTPVFYLDASSEKPDHGAWWPVFAGALALLMMGLVDDLKPLPARIKLIVQAFIAAGVVYGADLAIDSLRPYPLLAYGVAWAWLVLVSNAYNLLDHADGLCASVAAVSALVLISGGILSGDMELSRIYLLVTAILAGFLLWNLPPARIYMGDAGSLPLGFLIGVGTLSVTFWPSGEGGSPIAMLTPVMITALPLFDTGTVVIKRLRRGKPLMVGDRNHISHRLTRLGLNSRRSLLTAVALQVALAAGAIQLRSADLLTACVEISQAVAIFIAVVFLETARDQHS